uniref:Uncharacterized protein n=2 Tax=Culex quinquefasciatus TaxID=7176 RepID=A0A1S4JTJ4_CULQU
MWTDVGRVSPDPPPGSPAPPSFRPEPIKMASPEDGATIHAYARTGSGVRYASSLVPVDGATIHADAMSRAGYARPRSRSLDGVQHDYVSRSSTSEQTKPGYVVVEQRTCIRSPDITRLTKAACLHRRLPTYVTYTTFK